MNQPQTTIRPDLHQHPTLHELISYLETYSVGEIERHCLEYLTDYSNLPQEKE